MNYFEKMKGHTQSPPDVGVVEILWSWVGGFLGIAAVGLIHFKLLDQTGLMLIIGGDAVHRLGYLYVLMPAGLGAVVLLLVALLVNNLAPNRRYPEFW
ncbi:MAG: HPP family protein [Desulfatitalea sp.]|nr:HPP family protein [Desulfatitalea sp.]